MQKLSLSFLKIRFLKTVCASFAIATSMFTGNAFANLYAVANVGYSNVDTDTSSESDVSYSGAIGYQFDQQWYVEGGYISLIDKQDDNESLTSHGAYLALLGKAGSPEGELFYKVGVASISVEETLTDASACGTEAATCGFDDTIVAGLVGLGFDYYVSRNSMVRTEYMYLGGQDDFSAHIVNIGFRYNF